MQALGSGPLCQPALEGCDMVACRALRGTASPMRAETLKE